MDGRWNYVKNWKIKKGIVIFYDSNGEELGSKDVDDIIRNDVEGEVENDKLQMS